jgi:hypothetical protein
MRSETILLDYLESIREIYGSIVNRMPDAAVMESLERFLPATNAFVDFTTDFDFGDQYLSVIGLIITIDETSELPAFPKLRIGEVAANPDLMTAVATVIDYSGIFQSMIAFLKAGVERTITLSRKESTFTCGLSGVIGQSADEMKQLTSVVALEAGLSLDEAVFSALRNVNWRGYEEEGGIDWNDTGTSAHH